MQRCVKRRVPKAPPAALPPPWLIGEYNDAYFIVRDHNGQALAFVYCEDEPGRRTAAKWLTRDQARRIFEPYTFRMSAQIGRIATLLFERTPF